MNFDILSHFQLYDQALSTYPVCFDFTLLTLTVSTTLINLIKESLLNSIERKWLRYARSESRDICETKKLERTVNGKNVTGQVLIHTFQQILFDKKQLDLEWTKNSDQKIETVKLKVK